MIFINSKLLNKISLLLKDITFLKKNSLNYNLHLITQANGHLKSFMLISDF